MTIKDLTEEKLKAMAKDEPHKLYNLMYGPVADMLKELQSMNKDKKCVAAVYGATAFPIQRRMDGLRKLLKIAKLDTVIFSGGFGWEGVNANGKTIEVTKEVNGQVVKETIKTEELRKLYAEKKDSIIGRSETMLEVFPEIRAKLLYDLFEVETSTSSKDIVIALMDRYANFDIFVEAEYNKYEKKDGKLSYEEWLEEWSHDYIDNYIVNTYLINQITESEIMQINWNNEELEQKGINIVLESNSSDSRDNARFTLEKFLEAKKTNPELDTLIVISEWPYLTRQVQTTKKIAMDMGIEDIKILGFPAPYSNTQEWHHDTVESFISNGVSGAVPNLSKEIKYDDSLNFNIDKYLVCEGFYEGGPNITIGEENIPLALAIEEERKKATK